MAQAAPPVQPSAAAAAGAAAAALLQRQLAADGAAGGPGPGGEPSSVGWSEHQTGDGRKFYFHEETQTCTWEKPEALMLPEERANDTKWREYKIWDGRAFYHNKETKVSCWSMPPELRKLRGESSGIDDRPLPQTQAEKRRTFWDHLQQKGVDETWTWPRVFEATRGDPQTQLLDEGMRKQVFAELLGYCLRQKQIQARERDRVAASAFERLVEERFSKSSDLATTYEEASKQLSGEEAWGLIKSDVRRDEVFQTVMERLEEKHKKARLEGRTGRVVRLQRLMASDPELRRARLRWRDAVATLARKDEMQEEQPPLEALRVWSSLRDLRTAAEHDTEAKSKVPTVEATKAWREERKRRDAFVSVLKEFAAQGALNGETSWAELETMADGDPKLVALQEGPGATAMELFDDFVEELKAPPPKKRTRTGFSPAEPAKEDTNALDALIDAGGAAAPPGNQVEDPDPLMEVVTKAEERRAASGEQAAPADESAAAAADAAVETAIS